MTTRIPKGTWVEIHQVVLPAGERAPQVPADTQGVDLEMRAKGFLLADASLGEDVEIRTAAGRRLKGRLLTENPSYTHSFGSPVPALSSVGEEARQMLCKGRQ